MYSNDVVLNKIAEALLIDYSSVYYVNAVTNEYRWYSINPEFHSLKLEPEGKDFFRNMARDAELVVYEEDKHIFQQDIQKEKLLQKVKSGTMQSIVYRLVIDGKPVYHTLRLIREVSEDSDYFILGVLNIDKEVRQRQENERLEREREIFNQIAASLAEHYDTLYYIDMETNHYFEFSSTDEYKNLQVPAQGKDFFAEARVNIRKHVYPEDQEMVMQIHQKENILKNLENQNTYSVKYRLVVNGDVMHCRLSVMWANDRKHIIMCVENINAEVIADRIFLENQKNSVTYSQLAESLASHYDVIYYIDLEKGNYSEFAFNYIYGNLEIQEEGMDFFTEAQKNSASAVCPEDRDRVMNVLQKDYLLSALEKAKQFNMDYRLMLDDKPQYTRLTVMYSSDRTHFIIGVENITDEIRKEEEHLLALRTANELARRDELTGAKNKNAYKEMEEALQEIIDDGTDPLEFAIVVCDLNNLKQINDTLGHKAGDEYLCSSCNMIFDIFDHSPVFRIGGDEFVVVLRDRDYSNRDALFESFRSQVLENQKRGEGSVIAIGMSVFDPDNDHKVSEVFNRADNIMYENKKNLKGGR